MQQAADLVVQALKSNPSNLAALRLRYDWLGPDAPTVDRVSAMLALLQANPAQPWAATAEPRELAAAGLVHRRWSVQRRCHAWAPSRFAVGVPVCRRLWLGADHRGST